MDIKKEKRKKKIRYQEVWQHNLPKQTSRWKGGGFCVCIYSSDGKRSTFLLIENLQIQNS